MEAVRDVEAVIEETVNDSIEYLDPSLAFFIRGTLGDVVEWEAEGCYVTDLRGDKYLDALAFMGVFGLGHRHPEVVKAVKDQLDRIPLHARYFFNKPAANLAKLLAEISPGNLKYSFICNSASEAVDVAIKLARLTSGRKEVIGTHEAYHGVTIGALSITGMKHFTDGIGPLLEDSALVPYGDIKSLEKAASDKTAAIFLEPVHAGLGTYVPPDGYFQEVRKLCDKHGIFLVADETQTGLGRTGKMFGMEHYGVAPDMMTLGKTLSGGVIPIGCCMYTQEIAEKASERLVFNTSTFGGGELACAAAKTTIEIMLRDNLPEQVKEKGEYFGNELAKLKNDFPQFIHKVRGIGLMWTIEFATEIQCLVVFLEMLRKHRVIVAPHVDKHEWMRISPPLIAEKPELNKIINAFKESFKTLAQMGKKELEEFAEAYQFATQQKKEE